MEIVLTRDYSSALYTLVGFNPTDHPVYRSYLSYTRENNQSVHTVVDLDIPASTISVRRYTSTVLGTWDHVDFEVTCAVSNHTLEIIKGKLLEKIDSIYSVNFREFLKNDKS